MAKANEELLRAALAAEGVQVLAEKLRGSITYRNFRSPGRYSNWRKVSTRGTVALTGRRLLVVAGRGQTIDVPFDDPRRTLLELSVDKPGRLCIAITAPDDAEWSGTIEIRLKTPLAEQIVELWDSAR
jgi:hypothetical protein